MAKAMYAVVGGTTKKVKTAYAVVGGVTRKLKAVYAVVGGVTKAVWTSGSNIPKIDALFNGYIVSVKTYTPTSASDADRSQNSKWYNSDTATLNTLTGNGFTGINLKIKAVSKDGYYFFVTNSSYGQLIGYKEASSKAVTTLQGYADIVDKSNIKSTSISALYKNRSSLEEGYILLAAKFSNDNQRLCYPVRYKTSSSVSYYSLGLVFWKYNSSTNKFELEKDICLYKDNFSPTNMKKVLISDDLSTIVCKMTDATTSVSKVDIFKGSPDNGYNNIHSITTTNNNCFLDEEGAEYLVAGDILYRISGNSITQIENFSTRSMPIKNMHINYDRDILYLVQSLSGTGSTLVSYNVASIAGTSGIGQYRVSYTDFLYGTNKDNYALIKKSGTVSMNITPQPDLAYCQLSINNDKGITGYSNAKKINDSSTFISEVFFANFYSKEN